VLVATISGHALDRWPQQRDIDVLFNIDLQALDVGKGTFELFKSLPPELPPGQRYPKRTLVGADTMAGAAADTDSSGEHGSNSVKRSRTHDEPAAAGAFAEGVSPPVIREGRTDQLRRWLQARGALTAKVEVNSSPLSSIHSSPRCSSGSASSSSSSIWSPCSLC
jgi:hypothetical protein